MSKLSWLIPLIMILVLALLLNAISLMTGTGDYLLISVARAGETELKRGDIDPVNGKKIKYWVAPMDPTYIRNTPGKSPMGMDLVPEYEETGESLEPSSSIRIDPVTEQNMGVRTQVVTRGKAAKKIRTYGTVTVASTHRRTVSTRFTGWIETVFVSSPGEYVSAGDPLFTVYSPALVTAQGEYLLALRQQKELGKSAYPSAAEGAMRLALSAKSRLLRLGITEQQLQTIETSLKPVLSLTVAAPVSGVILSTTAVSGNYIVPGSHVYDMADLSTVWVDAEIYEYELPWVSVGMAASISTAFLPGHDFMGTVSLVHPVVAPKARTIKLRMVFDNPEGLLKPDMHADVLLSASLSGLPVLVPQEAVIHSGIRNIVFVARGNGRFEPREVVLGPEVNSGYYAVKDGLADGEDVVVSAQFMLDSESRLKEAVQKMLARQSEANEADDLNMDDLNMDDMALMPTADKATEMEKPVPEKGGGK